MDMLPSFDSKMNFPLTMQSSPIYRYFLSIGLSRRIRMPRLMELPICAYLSRRFVFSCFPKIRLIYLEIILPILIVVLPFHKLLSTFLLILPKNIEPDVYFAFAKTNSSCLDSKLRNHLIFRLN